MNRLGTQFWRMATVVTALFLVAAACGGSDADETTTTAAAQASTTEAAAQTAGTIGLAYGLENEADYFSQREHAINAAEARGYKLLEGSANGDCDQHVTDIENYISAEVDAIVILPFCGLAPYEDVVARALAAGITIVGYSQALEGGQGALLYDTLAASVELSNEAIRWINEDLTTHPEFDGSFAWALYTFDQCGEVCTTRTDTARDLIVEATGVDPFECEAVVEDEGLECAENFFQRDPSLNMIIAVGNSSGIGAYEAYAQTGRDEDLFFVGGWDGVKEAIEYVLDDGAYRGVMAIDNKVLGALIVDVPADLLEGVVQAPYEILLTYALLTPADPDLATAYLP